ncbi:Mis12-Mtw1 protein family-domain-containing protein [Schizophyllum fasciatum]
MKATKKVKKDPGSKSGKRKLFNGEEQPGGFIIARGPSVQPPSRAPSTQPTATVVDPPPPAKRKRTGSVPPVTTPSRLDVPNPRSRDPDGQGPCIPTRSSPELDEDAQAMTTEADELRRSSRSFSTTTTPAASQKQHQRRRSGVVPIPDAETESPTIERNRALRGEEARGRGEARTPTNGHRRRSSLSARGKRVSDIYASTGVIPTPHESVSGASFHKHIDHDQPEPERLRQVLIWHADRGASNTEVSSSLTPTARQVYARAQETFINMLHEKKIHLPTYHTDSSADSATMKPNKFNVTNAQWEATYTQRNEESEARYEEWNQCRYTYDEFIKKERAKLEKEKQADLSMKAKGKQRADEPAALAEAYFPQEHLIPDDATRLHVAIARDATASGATLARARRQRFEQFRFNIDQLRDFAHSARTLVRLASDALDARFAQLRGRLAAAGAAPYVAGGGSAEVLNAYARPTAAAADAETLLRAIFRVDAQRPQARQGPAAMSVARELRELGERGAGERRLTAGVVPPTPKRQVPGTPRRGTTPGRSNTPGRSGTPGR